MPVAAEDEPSRTPWVSFLPFAGAASCTKLLIAPLGLRPLAQAVPPPLARVQRLLVGRVGKLGLGLG